MIAASILRKRYLENSMIDLALFRFNGVDYSTGMNFLMASLPVSAT